MSETHTNLVIQISTAGPASGATAEGAEEARLIVELRRCLQPGVEIALVFERYMAITSILWLSELQQDSSLRAGVRLLGVSALPDGNPEPVVPWDGMSRRAAAAHSDSPVVRHHL